jgi:hypothetical protein
MPLKLETMSKTMSMNGEVDFDEAENTFVFDLRTGDENVSLRLVNNGLINSGILSNCLYFQYGFDENINYYLRKDFIEFIKFPKKEYEKNINDFIKNAVDKLHKTVNLYGFDTIVFPESRSEVNRKMISYLYMYKHPECVTFEIVKMLPDKLEFDYEMFEKDVLESRFRDNIGRIKCRYSEEQKKEELGKIKELMEKVRSKEYFSIARDFDTKSRYRKYLKNFYKFKNVEEEMNFKKLLKPKILLIDDVMTSGTTLSFILETICTLNPDAETVVFTLMGKY